LTTSALLRSALPAGMKSTRDLGSMGPPDTPSVGCRRPLGASVKPLRYTPCFSSHKILMIIKTAASCALLASLLACDQPARSYSFEIVQRYGVAEPIADSVTQAPHVRRVAGAVLGRITGAVQGSDSVVYVLDRLWRKIVVFDPDGTLRDVLLGGEGEGPGEFRNPIHMALLPTGELAVLDYSLVRLSYFDPVSGFKGSTPIEVHNPLRLFPIDDKIWITSNTLSPGEVEPRAIAVDRLGRRIAEVPPPVAAEVPFGGFPVLAVTPDSMLLLPHNRPGLWDVFDGDDLKTLGRELIPELQPPSVVREGNTVSIGSAMAGNQAVSPIAVSPLRQGQVIFWYRTMQYNGERNPLMQTRRTIAEVFTSGGRHLGQATLPPELAESPHFVHVSPFTDHLLIAVSDPFPHVLELRLVEKR
jgi:hypothetical protein